jgi:hypothetical protein
MKITKNAANRVPQMEAPLNTTPGKVKLIPITAITNKSKAKEGMTKRLQENRRCHHPGKQGS